MENGSATDRNVAKFGSPDITYDPAYVTNEGTQAPEYVPPDKGSESESSDDEVDQCDCADSGLPRLDQIPFVAIYDSQETVEQRGYYVPAYPITGTIIKVERNASRRVHLINPYIYKIELKHGPFQWTIGKRFVDFQRLHNSLHRYRTGSWLSAPFKKAIESATAPEELTLRHTGGGDLIEPKKGQDLMTKNGENELKVEKGPMAQYYKGIQGSEEKLGISAMSQKQDVRRFSNASIMSQKQQRRKQARHTRLPHFPILPDSVIGDDDLEQRKKELQEYLSAVLHVRAFREHKETIEFLEISRLSFITGLGGKYKEGWVKRRPGGSYTRGSVRNFCITHCLKWKWSWLVLGDTFLTYIDPKTGVIGDVLLFDKQFKVHTDKDRREETEGVKKGMHLSSLQRELLLKCRTPDEANFWKADIERILNGPGKAWTLTHPNQSGFPVRDQSYAQWFVDGRAFMEHAANMLDIAKEEIFIADWWFNPQIYLKRPFADEQWRLDQILKRKAEEGVHIFILVYREIEKFLMLGSLHMEQYLISLHPNIKVLRHPDHLDSIVVSFAHHEKLIVIDQKVAFVGGIDLCYGRWDDHEHKLVDIPGMDSCTVTGDEEIRELEALRKTFQNVAPSSNDASAPTPHEQPKAQLASAGASFNFAFNAQNEDISPQKPKDIFDILRMGLGITGHHEPSRYYALQKQQRMEEMAKHPQWKTKIQNLKDKIKSHGHPQAQITPLWVGKDYGNAYIKDLPDPQTAFEDFVDRTIVPRMPWHDISSVVYGEAARDVARHFIHRWNDAKHDLVKDRADYPFLLPKSYENTKVPELFRRMAIACKVQVLRSLSLWSGGLEETEMSIQNAYLKLIADAKNYIYIENQFFVSHVGGTDLYNKIAQALYDRIVQAHKNGETFRVYVMMPLLPGFTKTSGSMQMVLHWTMTSISKVGDYTPYISFCGLRKYDQLLGKLVTELIYIHSKLMIVDDQFCIIGSANINDRSQVGFRDSEVCVLVEDTQFTPSTMNGRPYKSGTFAGSLRRRLFQEHLGLLQSGDEAKVHRLEIIDVTDPASPEFYQLWNNIAKRNAGIYDQVFKCAPSDDLKTLQEWAQCEAQTTNLSTTDKSAAKKLLEGLRGNLVQFPTQFLSNADLTKDRFVPETVLMSYIFN